MPSSLTSIDALTASISPQRFIKTEIHFLDITIRLNKRKVERDLYTKPTDSHDYVLYRLAHPQQCKDSNKVFLITTFHPHDTNVKDIVLKNWDILGTSSTTTHPPKETNGRWPKSLREFLVRAALPARAGDEKCNPNYITPKVTEEATTNQEPKALGVKQLKIDRFLTKDSENPRATPLKASPLLNRKPKPTGTSAKECGFNFCNTTLSKYWNKLHATPQAWCILLCTPSVAEVWMKSIALHAKLVVNNMYAKL